MIFDVAIGLGHNNDKGMLVLSGLKQFLIQKKIKLHADGGYSLKRFLITPDEAKSRHWNRRQMEERSVVEIVFSLVHNWKAASVKYRGPPEAQAIALMTIYNLEALKLKEFPLRLGCAIDC